MKSKNGDIKCIPLTEYLFIIRYRHEIVEIQNMIEFKMHPVQCD